MAFTTSERVFVSHATCPRHRVIGVARNQQFIAFRRGDRDIATAVASHHACNVHAMNRERTHAVLGGEADASARLLGRLRRNCAIVQRRLVHLGSGSARNRNPNARSSAVRNTDGQGRCIGITVTIREGVGEDIVLAAS